MGRALRKRFDAIRRTEIQRLNRKLRGLSDAERESAEAIIHDVVHAIASVPVRALNEDTPTPALHALVKLFDLGKAEGQDLRRAEGQDLRRAEGQEGWKAEIQG